MGPAIAGYAPVVGAKMQFHLLGVPHVVVIHCWCIRTDGGARPPGAVRAQVMGSAVESKPVEGKQAFGLHRQEEHGYESTGVTDLGLVHTGGEG